MKVIDLAGTGDAWTFRRLPAALAELKMKPAHVIHVGAHLGQEVQHYRAAGIDRITLVEPLPANAELLRTTFPDATVLEVACGAARGKAPLRLMGGDGCWNTLIPGTPELHDGAGGTIDVPVVTLDEIQGDADMAVIDAQGLEVAVLSATDLGRLQLVVVETQSSGHPEAAHLDDVTAHLAPKGWVPALMWSHERPTAPYATFADVFFVRAQP